MAQKGSLFFAFKGQKTDGVSYLADVAQRGGFAAVVPEDYAGPDYGLVLLRVDDVLASMHLLATKLVEERETKIIGVTGSVGKTTTRHFLTQLLQGKFRVGFPPKNYNAQRTMPLVILNATGDEEFLILEMAMDRPGQIEKLAAIAPPDYAILTAITLAHYFGEGSPFTSLDQIAKEKAKIFVDRTKFAAIHVEAAMFEEVSEVCHCDHVLYPIESEFQLPFQETHLIECLSGAIEMALHLGMSEKEIEKKLPLIKPFERRFEKIERKGITFINDSYNASPLSSVAAIRNLPMPKEGGKKIVIFGAMTELGKFSLGAHRQVAREAILYSDALLCVGKECEPMVDVYKKSGKKVELFETKQELEKAMKETAQAGDVILVKGSNYHKLWEIIPKE